MDVSVRLLLLGMAITSICSLAALASVFWRRDSRSTRSKSAASAPPPTTISESRLAQLQTDQAELFSTLEKLTTTVKRLSSRQGMRDVRERSSAPEAPPVGASKAELLRHYGMAGKVGPDFARAQMQLEMHDTQGKPN